MSFILRVTTVPSTWGIDLSWLARHRILVVRRIRAAQDQGRKRGTISALGMREDPSRRRLPGWWP
jgi:hypothetical protein